MTNKLKYFIANWKMYGNLSSISILFNISNFLKKNKKYSKSVIIACVPNTLLSIFNIKLKNKKVLLGAQNCHQYTGHGPFTGAISSTMLKRTGAKFVIIGHSENRREGENSNILKKKIISSLEQNLNVIYCIGETSLDKKKNNTKKVLKSQIISTLNKKMNFKKIFIAYEPIWSIGSGKIINPDDLQVIIHFIKKIIKDNFRYNKKIKILFGGSVNSTNIRVFSKINEIDGFLVGGASLSSKKFIDIIRNYYK